MGLQQKNTSKDLLFMRSFIMMSGNLIWHTQSRSFIKKLSVWMKETIIETLSIWMKETILAPKQGLSPLFKCSAFPLSTSLPGIQMLSIWIRLQQDGNVSSLLANIPGFNLHWNNSVSMQERIMALFPHSEQVLHKRLAFEWRKQSFKLWAFKWRKQSWHPDKDCILYSNA